MVAGALGVIAFTSREESRAKEVGHAVVAAAWRSGSFEDVGIWTGLGHKRVIRSSLGGPYLTAFRKGPVLSAVSGTWERAPRP